MKYLIIEIPEDANYKQFSKSISNLLKNNTIKDLENELLHVECNIFDMLAAIENATIKDSAEDSIKSIEKYKTYLEEL